LAKATTREEATCMKELRAAEQAALRASRQALCDEVQRIRAERLAAATAAKAAKAAEKARKTAECQEQQRLRAARAAEMA
jgi:hypothetical protein